MNNPIQTLRRKLLYAARIRRFTTSSLGNHEVIALLGQRRGLPASIELVGYAIAFPDANRLAIIMHTDTPRRRIVCELVVSGRDLAGRDEISDRAVQAIFRGKNVSEMRVHIFDKAWLQISGGGLCDEITLSKESVSDFSRVLGFTSKLLGFMDEE
ncbi:MAG TPA: hypothetical protein VJJ47_00400 [Candidatus Paceibacterota bacterium]